MALEGYLARLLVELPHPKTRSTNIGAVTGFLHAVRQHRWTSLPAEAQLYPSDQPRRDETPRRSITSSDLDRNLRYHRRTRTAGAR